MTFKLHPLHTAEQHAKVMAGHGVLGYHAWLAQKRGTGRSTALVLKYIADAIESPGKAIPLIDHDSCSGRSFASGVEAVVQQLGLRSMHISMQSSGYFLCFGEPE